ncbi:Arm DNA-binding domain-containing protein [Novosphingobium sp. AAP1]|uniref:Arm DNA-binding domain-containing protein n=1 Tax=unclassified Novosphingobium TaxID=2644732 RepID=UPI00350F556A
MSNSHRLTALKISNLTQPGRYGDGKSLMLLVQASGHKSWVLRLTSNGKRRDFGLGGYPGTRAPATLTSGRCARMASNSGRSSQSGLTAR